MSTDRLQQLIELLKNSPDDAFLLYAVALEFQAKGNVREAIKRYEDLLLKQWDYLAVYYQLGGLYALLGDTSKAEETYTKGIEIATQQKNSKTLAELRSALDML